MTATKNEDESKGQGWVTSHMTEQTHRERRVAELPFTPWFKYDSGIKLLSLPIRTKERHGSVSECMYLVVWCVLDFEDNSHIKKSRKNEEKSVSERNSPIHSTILVNIYKVAFTAVCAPAITT